MFLHLNRSHRRAGYNILDRVGVVGLLALWVVELFAPLFYFRYELWVAVVDVDLCGWIINE